MKEFKIKKMDIDRRTEHLSGLDPDYVAPIKEETIVVTIEYISAGDTSKITNQQIMDKIYAELWKDIDFYHL